MSGSSSPLPSSLIGPGETPAALPVADTVLADTVLAETVLAGTVLAGTLHAAVSPMATTPMSPPAADVSRP